MIYLKKVLSPSLGKVRSMKNYCNNKKMIITKNNVLGQYVKIEEVFSDPEEENYEFQGKLKKPDISWRKIPIVIEEVKIKKSWLQRWNMKAWIKSCYISTSETVTDHYFFHFTFLLK